MKKFIIVFILTVFSLTLLAGCHGKKGNISFELPEAFDESRNYEISFWAKNDTNKSQVNIYQKAISDFEALYPNIKVNLRLYTDYGRIYNDVITNIATGTTPNVCITYPDHIATYMTGDGTVVPLDGLFSDEKYGLGGSGLRFDSPSQEELVDEFLSEGRILDHYYAVPFMRSTEACYVNRDMVEGLGYTLPEVLTWDFVWEVSEAAMEQNPDGTFKINGQNVMIPFIYKSTDNMMISMLKQLDAPYSGDDGTIGIFNDTTKQLLYTVSEHARSRAFSTFKISSYPANFLNAGQCIFAVDSTAGSTWMGSSAPLIDIPEENIIDFKTEVMMIPQFDTANPKMISQGPSICIFNRKDSQEVLASWLFTQFLLTNDVQIAYSQTEGYIPVTKKAQNSQAYQDYLKREGEDNDRYYDVKLKAAKLLMDNTSNTFVTPVFNGSASLRDAAGQLIEDVTKSTRRKETIDDKYMTKLFNGTTSLYRLDQIGFSAGAGSDLGPLPAGAKALIICIIAVWLFIIGYVVYSKMKKRFS